MSCKACLQGPFCHKPHESGPCCYKYMISAGTITSTGRTCDLRRGGTAATTLVAAKRPDEEELARRGAARPLAKYVRFETENGLALLYEPGN